MSWYMLSRRVHNVPYVFKKQEVTGSLIQHCRHFPYTFLDVERYRPLLEIRRHYASTVVQEKKSWKKLMYMTALVFGMVGCSYAAVPLYHRVYQSPRCGGTVQHHETGEEINDGESRDGIVNKREIAVQFNADVPDGMPWKFIPMQRELTVKLGESALAFYTAENLSSTPIVGRPTYKVTPIEAAMYFNCFCLEEQQLLPGKEVEMPVYFHVDPKLETDSKMDGINSLTLSYAFAKVTKE